MRKTPLTIIYNMEFDTSAHCKAGGVMTEMTVTYAATSGSLVTLTATSA